MTKIKLNGHHYTIILFAVALIANTAVHYSYPAYSYYEKQFDIVRQEIDERFAIMDKSYSNFVMTVENTFVPTINDLAGKIISSQSSESSSVAVSQIDDNEKLRKSIEDDFFDIRANFVMVDAKVADYSERGAYINGWFYREGDLYMGREIVSISPECVFLDRGIIRPASRNNVSPNTPQSPNILGLL